jgi:hypothetical protein
MKTIDEYMNDPRILYDSGTLEVPELIREIHAARLKIQDETTGMSAAERVEYSRKKIESFFGNTQPRYANLTGQGRLVPPLI